MIQSNYHLLMFIKDSEANSDEFSLQEQNQDYEVILGGDFNVDFSRI